MLRCREEVTTAPTALVAINSFDALVAFLKQLDRGLAGNLSAFEVMWQNFYQLVTQPPAPNQRPLQDDAAYYA